MGHFNFNNKKVACLMSCNENPKYLRWIPVVSKAWNALGIRPVVVLINMPSVPEEFDTLECDFILHNENNNIITSYVAQVIRNLIPGFLNDYDAVIISDIDMIPLPNKDYFEKYINESIDKQCFIGMRWKSNQCFMPWNVAPPKVWHEMFPVHSLKEVGNTIDHWYRVVLKGESDTGQFIRGGRSYLFDQHQLTSAAKKRPDSIFLNIPLYQLCDSWWETSTPGLYSIGAFDCNRSERIKIDITKDYDPKLHTAYNCAGGADWDNTTLNYIMDNILKVTNE